MDENGSGSARVVVRPIATPVPLTFVGLLIATTIVSGLELGWIPAEDSRLAGWALLGVPFPLQLLAAAWAFPARSAGAATGSAILAGTWAGYALVLVNGGGSPHPALGMMLVAAAPALLVAVSAELTSALVPALVLFATATRFGITSVYQLTGSGAWKEAGGIAGLVLAAIALYGAFALELESAVGRPLLPVGRRGEGKLAAEGSLADQLAGVGTSPGVRKKL